MNNEIKKSLKRRQKRSMRVRRKLKGSSNKPRLCVIKSNKHIYAQLIDDVNGKTIGAASTVSKAMRGSETSKKNKETAKKLGEQIAAIAKDNNINEIVFDRGPFKYHGILAELANAVREKGLAF
jgi:large subunit ribosomal protein L18